MPKPYKHLSQNEREQLAHMHSEGKSLGEIAKALGRNKSTISRELKELTYLDKATERSIRRRQEALLQTKANDEEFLSFFK